VEKSLQLEPTGFVSALPRIYSTTPIVLLSSYQVEYGLVAISELLQDPAAGIPGNFVEI